MTAVTEGASKDISTISGMKLYHLTSVGNGYTLDTPFSKITNVISCNRSDANAVYVTASAARLTFVVAGGGTPDIDLMVWGY